MFPRRSMLLPPGLTGSLLAGAAARCRSGAIAAAPGGVELSEKKPVGFSGGAMEYTDDLDLTIGYYDIAIEDRIPLTGKIGMPWASAAGSDGERRASWTRCRSRPRGRRRSRRTFARRAPPGVTTAPPELFVDL